MITDEMVECGAKALYELSLASLVIPWEDLNDNNNFKVEFREKTKAVLTAALGESWRLEVQRVVLSSDVDRNLLKQLRKLQVLAEAVGEFIQAEESDCLDIANECYDKLRRAYEIWEKSKDIWLESRDNYGHKTKRRGERDSHNALR